ncbi:Transcription regulator [Chondromyces apiculatus DSM 436]|uniref:Transcription regulator n=1 Tax=Chondromyces apiculatus DSM 436 TaxID=1192034 RepID=A0A017TA63_9BACT|nr:Transcription regulator [Chondromyces apiculatus DSM 436]
MKTWIIANPSSGTAAAKLDRVRELTANRPDIEVKVTTEPGHARALAMEAAAQGVDRVVAAGGDGTIHEVVQGLAVVQDRPMLGILPLGTGNDLARTLGISADPAEALAVLDHGVPRPLDLMKVEMGGKTYYGVNVSAGGFSGQVNEVLTGDMKSTWGPLAYVRGAMTVLPDLTAYRTSLAWDDGEFEQIDALNVVVANGRTCAGGVRVAPEADPADGLLDVVVVRYGSLLDLAGVATRLLAGDYLGSDDVSLRRVRKVRITSEPGMWFNIDGELIGNEPISFEAMPGALTVIAPPASTTDVPAAA